MALRAEVHDVAIVGAGVSLREFGVLGLGLPEQAHGGIEERGGESLGVDSFEALFGVHRAERRRPAVGWPAVEFVVARHAHRGETAQASAMENFRGLARYLEKFEPLAVEANSDRAVFVLRLDVTIPQPRVLEDVPVGIDSAGEFQFLNFFVRGGHGDDSANALRWTLLC